MEQERKASRSSSSYENELAELKSELVEKEQLLHRAGEIGNHLLENNQDLNKQLERQQNDYSSKIEELKQECHSLQLRLDRKSQLERNYADEVDSLKAQLRRQREQFDELRTTEQSSKVAELKRLVESQQASLDSSQLHESQLQERNTRLEEQLRETQEQLLLKVNMMNETCSQEMAELHMELSNMQADKMALQTEVCDMKDLCARLTLQVNKFQEQLESKDCDVAEQACLATSYYNALEKCREEVMELNVQLDQLKMETQNHNKRGNSVFAELDDKRQEAEKRLISQTVQLETLKKKYDYGQQQLHKLRRQLAALLQMSCSQADSSHVDRLKSQLERARGEIDLLVEKVQLYEKSEKSKEAQMLEVRKAFGGENDKNYADYVGVLLKTKEDALDKCKQELATMRMLNISEQRRVIELERKLYSTEVTSEKHRNEAIKLALNVEEYRMKYEPEKCKKATAKRYFVEQIPGFKKQYTSQQESTAVDKKGCVLSDNTKITENVPCATIKNDPAPAKMAVKGKSVRLSEVVDVFDVSSDDNQQDTNTETVERAAGENQRPARPRGRQTHHKVIKAPSGDNVGECSTQ